MLRVLPLLLASFAGLACTSICNSSLYQQLSCLEQDASQYCSSFVGSGYGTPSTARTTSISTIVHTTVVKPSYPVALMTSTGTTIVTQTIKPAAASTVYQATFITSAFETTTTVYTASSGIYTSASSTLVVSAYQSEQIEAAFPSGETCNDESALEALSSLGADELATACLCLGVQGPTSTLVVGLTVTRITTITLASGVATTMETGIIHLTAEAATTAYLPVTTSVTHTLTVYAAQPTYAQVWGPQEGCQDIAQNGTAQLDYSVTQQAAAVSQCHAGCTNTTWCDFVLVQRMYTDYGGVKPRWQCYYNEGPFNSNDVQCGRDVGIYGIAEGFSATGRG